jgi:hypothetical protein
MAVELNHTIVASPDGWTGARFLAEVLGLPEPTAVWAVRGGDDGERGEP